MPTMNEALILTAVDLSGRAYLGYGLDIRAGKVGDFDTELAEEFFCEAKFMVSIPGL